MPATAARRAASADVLVPIKGKLGAGVAGEFFDRTTYDSLGQEKVRYRFPQVRFYLS